MSACNLDSREWSRLWKAENPHGRICSPDYLCRELPKLWWVEKTARVQAAHGNEVTPLRATIGKVEPEIGGAETAIGGGDGALGSGHALARARSHVDDDARLLAVLSGWRTRDDLQRFDGIERNLVGENFALLIGNGLPIDRKRVLRVITHSVKEPIGIRGNSGRGQGNKRTQR